MNKTKPFCISKSVVWKAWLLVRANQGAAGVDRQSIADFEASLKANLYKIWNRMSSGSYFPPPVRMVNIPTPDGGERTLGIPTVADRVAQMVVKLSLEPDVEPEFHEDSYGYRPGKSAIDAVGKARRRCWRSDWVLDLDIKGFFDTIDHRLMLHAVRKHTDCPWILLYIERWLTTPAVDSEGHLVDRPQGTPQGGVISPLLANLFLHHVFDAWMAENYPHIPFERYADDMVVHCKSQAQAKFIHRQIEQRFTRCKLTLHPRKTKVVYCKDEDRTGSHEHESFDFLGFAFRARGSRNRRGKFFVNFSPAISNRAAKALRSKIRSWRIHRHSDKSVTEISRTIKSVIRGWLNYYGSFYRSALWSVFDCLNRRLVRWAQRKYKRYAYQRRATRWLRQLARREPDLFPHWGIGMLP